MLSTNQYHTSRVHLSVSPSGMMTMPQPAPMQHEPMSWRNVPKQMWPCQHEGCLKSARGRTFYCIEHGGGRRCQHEDCNKSARERTNFCMAHGGGRRCQMDDCMKSARGTTTFCVEHGGGRRCQVCCPPSNKQSPLPCI